MMKIKNMLLGLLIITTSIVTAQQKEECWDKRYLENPNVVTIYVCDPLHLSSPNQKDEYAISILVDSITAHQKIIKLYAHFNTIHEYPMFEAELTDGKIIMIYADYVLESYIEAWLTDEQIELFKHKKIKKLGVWHTYSPDTTPMIACDFSDFLARHE